MKNFDFVTVVKWKLIHIALRMSELRALRREHGLQGYSRLGKGGLIVFLQDSA